jgi:hypothetical protein
MDESMSAPRPTAVFLGHVGQAECSERLLNLVVLANQQALREDFFCERLHGILVRAYPPGLLQGRFKIYPPVQDAGDGQLVRARIPTTHG